MAAARPSTSLAKRRIRHTRDVIPGRHPRRSRPPADAETADYSPQLHMNEASSVLMGGAPSVSGPTQFRVRRPSSRLPWHALLVGGRLPQRDGVSRVFELVVVFDGHAEASRAAETVRAHPPLSAGGKPVSLLEPLLHPHSRTVSTSPAGVGTRIPRDDGPRLQLTAAELSELAWGLFGLLRRFDGYRAAVVGWDPEDFVECADLEHEYGDFLADGFPTGLVLAEEVLHTLTSASAQHFQPFEPGYQWIPYDGHDRGNVY